MIPRFSREQKRHLLLIGLLVLLAVVNASAEQPLSEFGLYDYTGDLDGNTIIGLTLQQRNGQKVAGSYFYKRYLKDIPLSGEFTGERDLVLREQDAEGKPAGRFTLHFAERDPRHRLNSTAPLTIDVLIGTWASADNTRTLPVYLGLKHIVGGEPGHRYRVAGAEDDALVERNAQAFRRAVANMDRQAVARLAQYPLAFLLQGKRVKAHSRADFLKHYDRIFTPNFVARIRNAVPHNMFARDQGIMLADGAVWFDAQGKVFALNN